MKKILYNGNVYRVRYVRSGADAPAARIKSCRKCAFANDGRGCRSNAHCTDYYKLNRNGRITHFSYYQRVNPYSPWPDIAIGLVGLAIAFLLGLICSK